MRRGAWHQFGDRSQLVTLEQLALGIGSGVVISPRDVARDRAVNLAPQYIDFGAELMIDPQFYIPSSTVGKLQSYAEVAAFRQTASQLHHLSDTDTAQLQAGLEGLNRAVRATAVIAPAVVYEAGRPDIADLNAALFGAAKAVGDSLGIPTLATVVVGSSASTSDRTAEAVLSDATSLQADGFYFAFEAADQQRIPGSYDPTLRMIRSGLALACTGREVFHAFAGPSALLSASFGATAVGVGHSQNIWQFTRERWQPADSGGGGGDAPPRLFSSTLWGTIVYADELALLSETLRTAVLTPSPFSAPVSASPPYLPWSRWEAGKHLVHCVCSEAASALEELDAQIAIHAAVRKLTDAIAVHSRIASEGVALTDNTNAYQNPWRAALQSLLAESTTQLELLRMIRGL